jgi:hemoglobin
MGTMNSQRDIENKDDIKLLVDSFYKKVLNNNQIGFIFTDVAKIILEGHMPKMYSFWESTLLRSNSYKGNLMMIHTALHQKTPLKKEHFEEWLRLFNETVSELFHGETAELAKTRALSIATVMQIKISQLDH